MYITCTYRCPSCDIVIPPEGIYPEPINLLAWWATSLKRSAWISTYFMFVPGLIGLIIIFRWLVVVWEKKDLIGNLDRRHPHPILWSKIYLSCIYQLIFCFSQIYRRGIIYLSILLQRQTKPDNYQQSLQVPCPSNLLITLAVNIVDVGKICNIFNEIDLKSFGRNTVPVRFRPRAPS